MRIVLVHGLNSNFNSVLQVLKNGRNFQYWSNSHISLDPPFWLRSSVVSWNGVFATSHWLKLSKITSILGHEILSNFNNTHKSCFLTKFTQSVFWWKRFNLLNVLLPNYLVISGIFIVDRSFCFNFTKNNWLSHQYHRLPKRACSARASSSLTFKEPALLWQNRQYSLSFRRRSCVSRRSTAACSHSPVRVPSFSLRKTYDFDTCFLEVADPRLYQVPQTFSPVWLDLHELVNAPSTHQWMDETSVFGCNDDGVVLLVRAQFVQDVRNGHSMLLAVLAPSEWHAPHLAHARMWHTARLAPSVLWSMSSARIAPPCFTRLRFQQCWASSFSTRDICVARDFFASPTNTSSFWIHEEVNTSSCVSDENCFCMKFNTRVRTVNLTSSSWSCTLLVQSLLFSWCWLSVEGVLCSLIAFIAQCSRELAPDVVLQIPLLLSAVTELTLQALHMTFVGDSFLELNGIREHVISIVDGNWCVTTLAVDSNSKPQSHSQVYSFKWTTVDVALTRQTPWDPQRFSTQLSLFWHFAGTESVPFHLHLAVKTLLSPTILSVLNPSLHRHRVSARNTALERSSLLSEMLTSGTSAHSMDSHCSAHREIA